MSTGISYRAEHVILVEETSRKFADLLFFEYSRERVVFDCRIWCSRVRRAPHVENVIPFPQRGHFFSQSLIRLNRKSNNVPAGPYFCATRYCYIIFHNAKLARVYLVSPMAPEWNNKKKILSRLKWKKDCLFLFRYYYILYRKNNIRGVCVCITRSAGSNLLFHWIIRTCWSGFGLPIHWYIYIYI